MIIGKFTKTDDNSFRGTIRTLTLNLEAAFEPVAEKTEKGPDYRVTAGGADLGAAWKMQSEAGNTYLSVRLEDPALPASLFCALVKPSNEDGYQLVWERQRKARKGGSAEF
jgi:uncharacterized protein (DUF736 family)